MGLVHVYTGDGKGKTTAAIGLATRFLGSGGSVVLVQFLKGQESGEINYFEEEPEIQIFRLSKDYGFTFSMNEVIKLRVKKEHEEILYHAVEALNEKIKEKRCLLILDECAGAISTGLIEQQEIIKVITRVKKMCEIVLTGRDFSAKILDEADYISDIKCARHPIQQSIVARKGIEF